MTTWKKADLEALRKLLRWPSIGYDNVEAIRTAIEEIKELRKRNVEAVSAYGAEKTTRAKFMRRAYELRAEVERLAALVETLQDESDPCPTCSERDA